MSLLLGRCEMRYRGRIYELDEVEGWRSGFSGNSYRAAVVVFAVTR